MLVGRRRVAGRGQYLRDRGTGSVLPVPGAGAGIGRFRIETFADDGGKRDDKDGRGILADPVGVSERGVRTRTGVQGAGVKGIAPDSQWALAHQRTVGL